MCAIACNDGIGVGGKAGMRVSWQRLHFPFWHGADLVWPLSDFRFEKGDLPKDHVRSSTA